MAALLCAAECGWPSGTWEAGVEGQVLGARGRCRVESREEALETFLEDLIMGAGFLRWGGGSAMLNLSDPGGSQPSQPGGPTWLICSTGSLGSRKLVSHCQGLEGR